MEGDWRNRGKPGGKEEKEKGLQLPASSETHVNSFDQLEYLTMMIAKMKMIMKIHFKV